MSNPSPFILKSLRQMHKELIGLSKAELTHQSLEGLMTKHRDGLVPSGAYNPVSHLLSGQQYVTDVEQLNALRFDIVNIVNRAISTVENTVGINQERRHQA